MKSPRLNFARSEQLFGFSKIPQSFAVMPTAVWVNAGPFYAAALAAARRGRQSGRIGDISLNPELLEARAFSYRRFFAPSSVDNNAGRSMAPG
jgi:hypothetical protein